MEGNSAYIYKKYTSTLTATLGSSSSSSSSKVYTMVEFTNYSTQIDAKFKSTFGLKNYMVLECDSKTRELSIFPHQEIDGSKAIKR